MYHSITFRDSAGSIRNTWNSWNVIPTTRPVINPPPVKRRYVDIPGANGSLDLTDGLSGSPVYEDIKGTFEFLIVNDIGYTGASHDDINFGHDFFGDTMVKDWWERYYSMVEFLHGRKLTMFLDDDPTTIYHGRFFVNSYTPDNNFSKITVEYILEPKIVKDPNPPKITPPSEGVYF